MTISSQQNANLSANSYGVEFEGKKGQMQKFVGRNVTLEGVTYKVLEYMDKPSGYQGAIYQRIDTGEIVVAHRGTEFDREPFKDGVMTDGGMATARINAQAADAIELTRHALMFAEEEGKKPGRHTPEVTVTGHSLGGTLAQITAYVFHLHGETFNAYGAASLGYGLPEGGNQVINNVMASDPVSAASHHFGRVRTYASPQDVIAVSRLGGYANDNDPNDIRRLGAALVGSAPNHSLHHFTNLDGSGHRDHSILSDANAQKLAAEYQPMFDKYRNDIFITRAAVSVVSFATLETGARIQEAAGHVMGRTLETSGHVVRASSQVTADVSRAGTHAVGVGVALGVQHSGAGLASAREVAGRLEAGVDHLQGLTQRQAASTGAGILQSLGSVLPHGAEKWMDSQARHLQQAGEAGHALNQREAATSRRGAHEDAAGIRVVANAAAAAVMHVSAHAGNIQHDAIGKTGRRIGNTLAVAGHATEEATRRNGPSLPAAQAPTNALSSRIDKTLAAAQSGDWNMFRRETQSLANGDAGQAMRSQAVISVDKQEHETLRQWNVQQQTTQHENPAIRHTRTH